MLTITTSGDHLNPATRLGFGLHKHPDRVQVFSLPYGEATVFYPEATVNRCTMALALEVDPIRLTRRGRPAQNTPESLLQDYVNDRPYASGSHLAGAIAQVLGTALNGSCRELPSMEREPLPLTIGLTAVRIRQGASLVRRLFEPLGFQVGTVSAGPDAQLNPEGYATHANITLFSTTHTLAQALKQVYILVAVLDQERHFLVKKDEIDKLLRHGKGWVENHPERNLIVARFLGHQPTLVERAMKALAPTPEAPQGQGQSQPEETDESADMAQSEHSLSQRGPRINREETLEQGIKETPNQLNKAAPGGDDPPEEFDDGATLNERRHAHVLNAVAAAGGGRVLDLGCGEGRLSLKLAQLQCVASVEAVDVSPRALGRAQRTAEREQGSYARKIKYSQASLLHHTPRLAGADVAVAMEVIEHVDPHKLDLWEENVLGAMRPGTLVLTTPNREWNELMEMAEGETRHQDHRFEWDRRELTQWAQEAAARHGYTVSIQGIGPEDSQRGQPTQCALFTRKETGASAERTAS